MTISAPKQTPLAKIVDADVNPRHHPPRQIKLLTEAIEKFGFTSPVLIDEKYQLITGHARVAAARKLGMKTIPAISAKGWSDDEKKACIISDNRLGEMGAWDWDELQHEIHSLRHDGVDMGAFGFDEGELRNLYGEADIEDDPKEKSKAQKRAAVGDIWTLGNHTLLVAQPSDTAAVAKAMQCSPALMVTAPSAADESEWYGFNGGLAYVWFEGPQSWDYYQALERATFEIRQEIIWKRPRQRGGGYAISHSKSYLVTRNKSKFNFRGGKKQSTVWESLTTDADSVAPVEARRRCIANHTEQDDWVYDPNGGDGDTLLACQMEERRGFIVVADSADAGIVITRWERYTKLKAEQ